MLIYICLISKASLSLELRGWSFLLYIIECAIVKEHKTRKSCHQTEGTH